MLNQANKPISQSVVPGECAFDGSIFFLDRQFAVHFVLTCIGRLCIDLPSYNITCIYFIPSMNLSIHPSIYSFNQPTNHSYIMEQIGTRPFQPKKVHFYIIIHNNDSHLFFIFLIFLLLFWNRQTLSHSL